MLEEAALTAGIPYRLIGSTAFYQRKEIKDMLAYLRLLLNEHDDVSLERIFNKPARGIGQVTVNVFKEWAADRGLFLSEALTRLHECSTLGRAAKQALASFAALVRTLRQAVDDLPFTDLLDQVARLSGLEQYYKAGGEEEQERWENIQELKRVASRFAGAPTPQALLLFLEHVALMSGADHAQAGEQEDHSDQQTQQDAVTFLTLHAAKGLEFETVFLVGVEEGLIPHSKALLEDADIESLREERRLFYVGLSRARRRLYCLRATRRCMFNTQRKPAPSRFLAAIPAHLRQSVR